MADSQAQPPRFSSVWRFRRRRAQMWKTRMLALLAALPDLMFRIDADGMYVGVHAPNQEDLAVPLAGLIGMNVREALPPLAARQYFEASERVFATGEVVEYEYELDVPSGRQVFDARLVQSGPNEVTSIIRNITEKRRLQEQSEARRVELALERERRIILERFIQDASHDLRTPITALVTTGILVEKYVGQIRTQFEALSTAHHAGQDTRPYVEAFLDTVRRLTERQQMMTVSSERLMSLVDAMFDMIRLDTEESLPLTEGRLDVVAEAVIYMLQPEAETRGIALTLESSASAPIRLHSEMMQRAVQNLVVNAINYTPDGGNVILRLSSTSDAITLDVVDTGIGIPPEHIATIFQRFYRVDGARTARTGGSGLGLSIAQRIVELHGGRIEVESEPGGGSTFRIVLPKARQHE